MIMGDTKLVTLSFKLQSLAATEYFVSILRENEEMSYFKLHEKANLERWLSWESACALKVLSISRTRGVCVCGTVWCGV